MDLLELDADVRSPATPVKLVTLEKVIGLNEDSRVIDFGCGCGEALALWAKAFDIRGVGVDRDPEFCSRATARLVQEGLTDRINMVCANAAGVAFQEGGYDVAACVGASMIRGGFRPAIRSMRRAIQPIGQVVIVEAYFTRSDVPQELVDYEGAEHTESGLCATAREEGFELAYVSRGSSDDWARYAANCFRDIQRIKGTADPAQREAQRRRLHPWQAMYVQYRRPFQRGRYLCCCLWLGKQWCG
jgi:ubiquinone/menaquinone biosynthesis C-methylase UbiE